MMLKAHFAAQIALKGESFVGRMLAAPRKIDVLKTKVLTALKLQLE